MNYCYYLINASLSIDFNDIISTEININSLADVIKLAKENKESYYKLDTIYEMKMSNGLSLCDLLYNGASINIDHNVKKQLLKIIDHCRSSNKNEENILDDVLHPSVDLISGILTFNRNIENINKLHQIKCKDDWYDIHLHYLGVYYNNESEFYNGCCLYYPNLYLHPNVQGSLCNIEGGLIRFSNKIVFCLKMLNNEFKKYYIAQNRTETLKRFSSVCGISTTCEGNAERKLDFTFSFDNDSKQKEQVCCEPHMKLDRSDDNSDTHNYHNRIYFHEGKNNIQNGKILIAHIGQHL